MTYPSAPLSNPWATGFVNATTMYNNTTVPLNQIAAVLVNQGAGSAGHAVLGSSVTGIGSTPVTVLTVTIPVVAGRKYLLSAYFGGNQVTTTGNATVSLQIAGSAVTNLWFQVTPVESISGTSPWLYVPGSSGSVVFSIVASTSAGTLTVAAAWLLLQDLGTL